MDELATIFMEQDGMNEQAAKAEAAEARDIIREMKARGERLTDMLDAWFELTGLEPHSVEDII